MINAHATSGGFHAFYELLSGAKAEPSCTAKKQELRPRDRFSKDSKISKSFRTLKTVPKSQTLCRITEQLFYLHILIMTRNSLHTISFIRTHLSVFRYRLTKNGFAGARFSKAPESFRARKAIYRSSVPKNGEVYTPETSCMKETSLHL